MAIILANGENSCPLRNVTNYMGTLRKVKGVHPLMDKGFRLLWYICMGEVQVFRADKASRMKGNPVGEATLQGVTS
jgi:hypothetical protein